MARIRRHTTDKPVRGSVTFAILLVILGIGLIASFLLPALGFLSPAWFTEREAFLGIGIALVALALVMIVMLVQLTALRDQVAHIDIQRPATNRKGAGQTIHLVHSHRPMVVKESTTTQPTPKSVQTPQVTTTVDDNTMLVTDLEGIGKTYTARLSKAGIITVPELIRAHPRALAKRIDAMPGLVREWQAMGRLVQVDGIGPQYAELLVHAGIRSPRQLARSEPAALEARIAEVQANRDVALQGNEIREGRTRRWIDNARRHGGATA